MLASLAVPTLAYAGLAGSDLFLPMVARQVGVYPSNWYTTVWIHNPGAQAATVRIYFLERGTANPSPPWVDLLVAPGDTEKIENIVESLFGLEKFGAIRVTCATQKLVVTSRVYSKAAGAGEADSLGQDFAGVPASFAIGLGEKAQVLGVHQTLPAADSEHRFNFSFVETAGASATVRVSAYDDNNAFQGSKDFNVLAFSQRQVAFKDHFPGVSTANSRLEVEVIAGAGRIIAYGSAVANGSQDPTTFEMTYAQTLLAENAGPALTGVTAGQGLSGGGTSGTVTLAVGAGAGMSVSADQVSIADGGVTAAKILDGTVAPDDIGFNFAGSASKGGAATSLALPSSGAGNQAEPSAVLAISNNGTGPAILGTSTSSGVGLRGIGTTGVEGDAGTGSGVLGQSTSWNGVHGLSASGFGVRGDSTDGAGVYGISANSNGVLGRTSHASAAGVRGEGNGGGTGVFGYSGTGFGVYGTNGSSDDFGFLGGPGYGVLGNATSARGVGGFSTSGEGVYGSSSAAGVYSETTGGGYGVKGQHTGSGNYGILGLSREGV